jgi:predicted nucleic acid-binding Zn ribbon protein
VTPRGPSDPTRVGAVVGRVLDDLGFGAARLAMQVQERWSDLVGPEAAAHSGPEGLRGSILEVRVDASVWGQQLQLHSAEILRGLRELLGERAPTQLRFRVGAAPGSL